MPIPSTVIHDLATYVQSTDSLGANNKLVLFRGQPVQGSLLPSVARTNSRLDSTKHEQEVLSQLALLGASLVPNSSENKLELMVLAQHFGLRTRLLDWTSNPLAALWFACSTREPGDVYVYSLVADALLAQDLYAHDPFSSPETRVFQPRLSNARILAQHGWFTLHRWSPKGKRFVPLELNPRTKSHLVEHRVPQTHRANLLSALDRHGISARTLFPELSGLCTYLNWRHGQA